MSKNFQHSHRLTKHVKLLQKAALWHKGECLILRRSSTDYSRARKWDLPGGNTDWPAHLNADTRDPHKADILREIAEETGVMISTQDLEHAKHELVATYFEPKKQVYSVLVGWSIELPDSFDRSSITLSHEHQEQAWITKDQFDSYDFGFAGKADGFLRAIVGL